MKIIKSISLLVALASSQYAHAVRWFEVEIIAFEQASANALKEDFSIELTPLPRKNIKPLLLEGFNNTGHQLCLQGSEQFIEPNLIKALTQGNYSTICNPDVDYVAKFDELPLTPRVEPQEHMNAIYLLDKTQLNFTNKINELKRKGLNPILHTGWRFPEQSKRRAPNIEIIAGKQHKPPLSYTVTQSGDSFSALTRPFDVEAHNPQAHFQLEGQIKIHVRHYLYVTTNLDLRYEEGQDTRTARMSQYTRVYSGDIHYLDHPKLGVIFQIRKYKH
ncbi:CsiV family protein [Pseudoalteromonas peptidolytica]|uniref:Uncharacterized protein n=1 Tax=Pseudoalteromonas peptidolytica F12-50-A1 TaxID=1315280 RepID=A0A8I0MV54_9GAMM|nr:CsiV family protein [Pseudoalteromonas peptidolytica]MBE0346430.1 hypothetical protein [Pseudoalteromonas peptidolytica F12-50-A1]NLR14627.1 hypothetical protein [Pseudoalteromonas peptidolytica]GEK09252.1 hypothetical protein PPE03_15010 [Pseudoalteromonas peptidolytica]